jgi:hypothetical protein
MTYLSPKFVEEMQRVLDLYEFEKQLNGSGWIALSDRVKRELRK